MAETHTRPLRPGFWLALLMVVAAVVAQAIAAATLLLGGKIVAAMVSAGPWRPDSHPIGMAFANVAGQGLIIAWGVRMNEGHVRDLIPFRRVPPRVIVAVAASIVGTAILSWDGARIVTHLLPVPDWLLSQLNLIFTANSPAYTALLVVVAAPITEEVLFRGIILNGLMARHRPATAVLFSSLLFAVFHVNPWQFPIAMSAGLLLGWFYVRSGSLTACVLGHAMLNAVNWTTQIVLPSLGPGDARGSASAITEWTPWWLNLCGLTLLLGGIALFRRASMKHGSIVSGETQRTPSSEPQSP